ncbi:MAG TPA: ABC transporter permease [Actinomycetes bacterium]|nr:ABC transporter permease [Actinomycetes bacterium]
MSVLSTSGRTTGGLPPAPSAAALVGRSVDFWRVQYRRTWRGTWAPTVLTPLGFLAAMGLGLGSIVDEGARAQTLGGVSYLDFIAPGLMAASVMQQAAFESSYPVLGAIKWAKQYHAQLAAPLRVRDVLAGHVIWVTLRLGISAAVFLVIMALFGTLHSPWAVLCIPAAVLTGAAWVPGMFGYAATLETDSGFALVFRFLVMPMFLFSGTFFPISQLPDWLEWVAVLTPLWHGVELCRDLALGTPELLPSVGHVAYLCLWVAVGFWWALRTFTRRLVS